MDTIESQERQTVHTPRSSMDDTAKEALREAMSESPFDPKQPITTKHSETSHALSPSDGSMPTFHSIQAPQAHKHPFLHEHSARLASPSLALTDSDLQAKVHHFPGYSQPSVSSHSSGQHDTPSLSSIETLRLLQGRERSTTMPKASSSHSNRSRPPSRGQTFDSFTSLPSSWWRTNKDNVDELLREDDQAPTVEEERAKIHKRYRSTKNPVVFCHGLMGFDSVKLGGKIVPLEISHWKGIKEVLEANGTEVLFTRVPAISSPIERAKVLAKTITEKYKGRSIHLIDFSEGGLDARYVASHLQGEDTFKVLSVTTVSAPHRGTYAADHFLGTFGVLMLGAAGKGLPAMVAVLNMLPIGGDGDGQGYWQMENMKKFNEETPDAPDVQYFSWGAEFEPGLIPHSIILPKQGPNDGFIAVESAKWGKYQGTLKGVSHSDLVGWVDTARYTWAEWTGRSINFKPATFYLEMVDHLARVVEGGEEEGQSPAFGEPAESRPEPSS
ncbi:hypothetical protein FRC00_010242 [Tulasnella sp. 408]|nr:hypothetical protein FRC00_010242 [Tulasnella sp. 408]